MKLYILRPVENLPKGDNPWEPWYNKNFGFVVRAENEEQARDYAHKEGGDENRGDFLGKKTAKTTQPWKDSKYTSCIELNNDGDVGIIICDFASA